MVTLGDVDQLEVHGKSAHDPPQLLHAHAFYLSPEPLVELWVVIESQPLAEESDLLLGLEELLALLLDEDPPQHPPQEVDVPSQGLVFRIEADPWRKVSVSGPRYFSRSIAECHQGRVTLPLVRTTTENEHLYMGTTEGRT
jgi:hypothetical protein